MYLNPNTVVSLRTCRYIPFLPQPRPRAAVCWLWFVLRSVVVSAVQHLPSRCAACLVGQVFHHTTICLVHQCHTLAPPGWVLVCSATVVLHTHWIEHKNGMLRGTRNLYHCFYLLHSLKHWCVKTYSVRNSFTMKECTRLRVGQTICITIVQILKLA